MNSLLFAEFVRFIVIFLEKYALYARGQYFRVQMIPMSQNRRMLRCLKTKLDKTEKVFVILQCNMTIISILDDEQTPRVVGWARSLANGLSNGSSNENRRQRTMSDRSYESITDLNPDDGISTGTTSTRQTTITTITSEYDAAISDTTGL